MRQVLLGSQNRHKVTELASILKPALEQLRYKLVSAADVSVTQNLNPAETGQTFQEIVTQKALAFGEVFSGPVLADDSGLEVTALGGKPGIHSKRYAAGTDQDRVSKLLAQLENASDRSARFVTWLGWLDPESKQVHLFEGYVRGTISSKPAGINGFGYDPVFVPDGYSQSFAELTAQQKNKLSHRARAARQLADWLVASAA